MNEKKMATEPGTGLDVKFEETSQGAARILDPLGRQHVSRIRDSDEQYSKFLTSIQTHVANIAGKTDWLFKLNIPDIWDLYMRGFPHLYGKHYNCRSCRHFIKRYGSLVVVVDNGTVIPAIWPIPVATPILFRPFVTAIYQRTNQKIGGAFFSEEKVWGEPQSNGWSHLSVHRVPSKFQLPDVRLDPHQRAAQVNENKRLLDATLDQFVPSILDRAIALAIHFDDRMSHGLQARRLLQWVRGTHDQRAVAVNRDAMVWKLAADAPAGAVTLGNTMIGSFVKELAAGVTPEIALRHYNEKADPTKYMRPQALPTASQAAEAEKVLRDLYGESGEMALQRRPATFGEVPKLWISMAGLGLHRQETVNIPFGAGRLVVAPPRSHGPYSRNYQPSSQGGSITVEKFLREVAPTATSITYLAGAGSGYPFTTLVGPVHMNAARIIKWDDIADRNPYTWYCYSNGNTHEDYGLESGKWVNVSAIVKLPSMWGQHDPQRVAEWGVGVILVLSGARDRTYDGGGLFFPEFLIPSLYPYRKVFEAYSNQHRLHSVVSAQGPVCGIDLRKGRAWGRVYHLEVVANGLTKRYILDRWD